MANTEKDPLMAVLISLARIEERQEAAAHRARNIDMKLDACVRRDDLKPLEMRVEKLEGFQSWATRTAGTVGIMVFGGLAYFGKKMGGA